MTVRHLARAVPPGLVLVLLMHPRPEAAAHGPPKADDPPKAGGAWTFDEARDRLALSPRDPYLQYVVLQLGRRHNREQEAYNAVERRPLLGGFLGNGRRQRADLFATFTGALAIQESLQLDTMRGDNPNARPQPPDPKGPQPPKPPAKVAVKTLVGPTQPSHPWEKMLAGKKPDVGPLAGNVPEEFYFAEFRSAVRLHEVLGAGELWAGHVFTQALGGARSQLTADRVRKQLGLGALSPEQLDRLGVDAVAITGSDPFISEGSDVTLLVQGKNIAALATLADAAKGDGNKGEHAGIAYTHRSTPDGAVNVFAASPRPDLHVRGNSLPAFKKVLEAVAGKTKRLGDSAEFKYVRTRMVREANEDGFVYLSDAFIRYLTGPQLKLTERRRVVAYNHLRMIGHAALMFRTEHGRPPKSLEELAKSRCAPGVFGAGALAHPDGGTYSLTPDGMSAVCSKFGRTENLTPCAERLVTEVSGDEAEGYKRFVADYSQYWRTFFDPIAIRVTVAPKQYRLETLVLPLIDNSIYTELARHAGKPVPMDLLPTPKREIGGLWVHLPKKPLLDILGPEQAAKEPRKEPGKEPGGAARGGPKSPFEVQNDLKQIALGVHNYHDTTGQLPTTNLRGKNGKPLLSWRVAILPYVEQEALYKEFRLDEAWDSGHNKKLVAKMPRIYYGADEKLNAAGKTAYLVPSGKGTLSPPDGGKLALTSITDGMANTILAAAADPERAVEWTKPDDLPFDPKDPLRGFVRPGQEGIDVLFADGSTKRLSAKIDPKKFALLITPNDGQPVTLDATEDLTARGAGPGGLIPDFLPDAGDIRRLEAAGVDLNKLRKFLRDGIGDQIGFHMHDAPRLLDSDLSGLFGGDAEGAGLTGLGLLVRFAFGASSVSIPVKDAKVVDEYLDELDKLLLAQRKEVSRAGLLWRREADFYRVQFPKPHTVRCLVVSVAGLKWRLYWGRIGDGLYLATRPFILEDIAAAQADGKKPAKSEPAHAVLRVRPENWGAVLPGYNLGWAESNRAACAANLDTISNVARGWNDRPKAGGPPTPELLGRVGRVYGERPFCPDGGTYDLSADGRACRCSVHGGHDDPRQPAAPTAGSATGKLLKTFGGLTAAVRFEEDGLRVVVTMDRKE